MGLTAGFWNTILNYWFHCLNENLTLIFKIITAIAIIAINIMPKLFDKLIL